MKSMKDELSDELRNLLIEEFDRRRLKNKRYSLKAFAKSIGGSDSYLQRLFTGKRNITYKRFLDFARKANIPESTILSIIKKHNKDLKKKRIFETYTLEQYKVLDSIKASILLNIVRVLPVKKDYSELANLRGYTKDEVRTILDAALRLNVLQINSDGFLVNESSRILPVKMDDEAEKLRIKKLNQSHEYVGDCLKSELKGPIDSSKAFHSAMAFAQFNGYLTGKNRKFVEETAKKAFSKITDGSLYKNRKTSNDKGAVYLMTFNIVKAWSPEDKD